MLTFDESTHTYRWCGQPVPHVTGVLKPLIDYSMVPAEQLEIARQKGVAVHKMVELDCRGELADLPDWMVPVYEYWLQTKAQLGLEILDTEQRVYHRLYRYAGTLDLRVRAHNTRLKGVGIIDIKRSFAGGKTIGLQTAAYAGALDQDAKRQADRIQWRAALRLREDQKPQLRFYEDRNDFNVFTALLTVHNWRQHYD